MISQRAVLIGTIIITACIVSPICIVPCRADIADMASLRVGGTLTNSSSISMLDACANIRLVRSESGVSAQVSCRFMVVSNKTVNASLAFVYPEHWRAIYGSGGINIDFSTQVNDSLVNTTLLTWENLTSQGFFPDPLDFAGGWVEGANFVLFSFEMLNNTTYVVETKTWAYPLYSNHYGNFYYIVGSARTFSGNAHQQVELLVVEETPFESIGFFPENSFSESQNESGTIATWDFFINDEPNITHVGASFIFAEYRGSYPQPYPYWLTLPAMATVVLTAVVVIRRSKQKL